MMNLQPTKFKDYSNHQWVLSYGDIKRTVDFFQSEEYVKEVLNEMIQEHRAEQLKKILDNEDN